jgi:hypothetical protein
MEILKGSARLASTVGPYVQPYQLDICLLNPFKIEAEIAPLVYRLAQS